ncbi:hypothetical protein HHI36_019225 [Cryptolaemus montrouzieri]|uniref:Uncharacterized protein n=1 Tax=Cryptolaemus montrouzieri TaxID=559131 RepID=A0ABD2P342_9CUCU
MTPHIEYVTTNMGRKTTALTKIMPNCGGLSCRNRRMYSAVAHIIGLYEVCAAYRTVSAASAQVLSGTPPMDLLAEEKRRLMEHKYGHQPGVQWQTRKRIFAIWQERTCGEWTVDDLAHVLECARWRSRINELLELFGERATPERNMRHLIDESYKWQKGARIISDIMEAKEREKTEKTKGKTETRRKTDKHSRESMMERNYVFCIMLSLKDARITGEGFFGG